MPLVDTSVDILLCLLCCVYKPEILKQNSVNRIHVVICPEFVVLILGRIRVAKELHGIKEEIRGEVGLVNGDGLLGKAGGKLCYKKIIFSLS